ncbi:MAG TPA: glycosyltransferase family 39 protein, partial [Vicinamibacteria bacterium]|nr:glycosyltransferase family 39 protein [Vicinamibacteria bacterium]
MVFSAPRAALLAILALAAALRFTGLGWGLRHPPHMDERVFVENVFEMMRAGDLDHRYYEYPGLAFYLLWPLLRPLADEGPVRAAYLLARGLVAVFGVLGCALLYPLGRRLHSQAAGLLAAALMAVCVVAVETAHMFRPDVILQALCALALLAFAHLDGSRRAEARAGAALGLAMAAKFSGVFLVPSYLAARSLAPGPRVVRVLLGGAVAALAFALASPYALLHLPEFVQGVQVQLRYHYQEQARSGVGYGAMLLEYAGVWAEGLGLAGLVLSLVGLREALRAWRRWLPALLLAVVSLAVLPTSDVRHDRFLLPALTTGCLLAGAGAAALARAAAPALRASPGVACFLAGVLMVAGPLRASASYAREMSEPLTRDILLDWVAANVPARARVLSSVPLLGLDPERHDVLALPRLEAGNRVQVLDADVVLSTGADA